jgi:hypothetical protein
MIELLFTACLLKCYLRSQAHSVVTQSAVVASPSIAKVVESAAANELPFVHTSQRQSAIYADDTIIVVGQRQKRKHAKKGESEHVTDGKMARRERSAGSARSGAIGAVPFDYLSASNILDDEPEAPEGRRSEKKRQMKGECHLFRL